MYKTAIKRTIATLLFVIIVVMPFSAAGQINKSGRSNNGNITNPLMINDEEDSVATENKMPEGIVYDSGEEADSVMPGKVFAFPRTVRDVKIRSLHHPTLSPDGVELINPASLFDGNYYVDRGALGQTHLSVIPYLDQTLRLLDPHTTISPLSQQFQSDALPAYRKNLHSLPMYQTLVPYTLLSYGSSLNKDYKISVLHTQNIKPRWNAAFIYDLTSRDGVYTNAGGTNHMLDVTTNYYSADSRYQLQGSVTFNKMRQEENGGVKNDTTCWESSRRAGVPVNMYKAQNMWRDLEFHLHQSFNTVRQVEKIVPITTQLSDTTNNTSVVEKDGVNDTVVNTRVSVRDTVVGYDTIMPATAHTYNTGVFALDLHYGKHRRIFTDSQTDSWFYDTTLLDTTFYFDSTAHHKLYADLYWTNDAYMSHRWKNPLVILFGVRPELNRLQFATSHYDMVSVSPFARVVFNIGQMRLSGDAEEVTGSHSNGDYRLAGKLEMKVGKRSRFDIGVLSEALSPDIQYYRNDGYYSWDINDYNKIKRQQVALGYRLDEADTLKSALRLFETRTSAMLISDNVWFNDNMQPVQGNATGMLLQASVNTHLKFGWFNIRMSHTLQHSSDEDVMRVPLFASKNSFYADAKAFKKALLLQFGVDMRYHTLYHADGWNPILGAYYRQDDVEVGNYFVADIWLTLQIKRASIYLKASHINAPLEKNPHYFSLPHYPMEDFGLYWGVIWKFFN